MGAGSSSEREIELAVDQVELQKRYEPDAFERPGVRYTVHSARRDPADVRVIETIPDSLSPSDLGFTDDGTERVWAVRGPKLVFETTLEPGETVDTACVARRDAAGDIDALLGEPDAVEVTPLTESAGSFTRSAGAGTEAAPAEQTATPATEADDDAEREQVVERFVEELRAGAVSSDSVEYLREELGATEGPPRSVEVRLKQLQSDLSDVRAYTNALEAFIDEQGTAEAIIERFEGRLDTLANSVENLDGEVADNDAELDRLQADVGDLESAVHALTRELEALGETVDAVDEDLDSIDDRLDDLEAALPNYDIDDRFAELDDELEEVSTFTEDLRSVFSE